MKWKESIYHHGDKRIIKRFALFPISAGSDKSSETRWLESVVIEQMFVDTIYETYWWNLRFIDEEPK